MVRSVFAAGGGLAAETDIDGNARTCAAGICEIVLPSIRYLPLMAPYSLDGRCRSPTRNLQIVAARCR